MNRNKEEIDFSFQKLFKIMKEKGISRQELSHAAGISYSSLSRLSNNLPLQMDSLVLICKVLNCRIDDIVDY